MAEVSKLCCGLLPTVPSWQEDPSGPWVLSFASVFLTLSPSSALPNCAQLPTASAQPVQGLALIALPASSSRRGLPHTLAPASKFEKGQISLPVKLWPTALMQLAAHSTSWGF